MGVVKIKMVKIFVLHCKNLGERKRFMLKQFEKQGITDYEFIESHDPDDLSDEYLDKFNPLLGKSRISLIAKHFEAYSLVAKEHDFALILEDDAILADNFAAVLDTYISQLPPDFDCMYLGDCCDLHVPDYMLMNDTNVYLKSVQSQGWGGAGSTKCTDSYYISKKYAHKMLEYFSEIKYIINKPADHWFNDVYRDLNMKVYWAEPTIVSQGSHKGLFSTALV